MASKKFEVVFYETADKQCPVEEFMIGLEPKMRAKLAGILKILQDTGPLLREPYSKALGDGIFEVRGKVGSNITRVLYFFYYDGKIVLTNGFVKKTSKTPKREIVLAKKYRKDYQERYGNKK